MRRYLNCGTVGELRQALDGLPDNMPIFGDYGGDYYVSVTIDLTSDSTPAIVVEQGALLSSLLDRIADESAAYCNGYDAITQGMAAADAIASAQRFYGDELAESFRQGVFSHPQHAPKMKAAQHWVDSDERRQISPAPDVLAFADAIALEIKARLTVSPLNFSLVPYRCHGNILGFDWVDAADQSFSITFHPTRNPVPLLETLNDGYECGGVRRDMDVQVPSWVDALLIIRLIAQRVNGNSMGEI